MQGQRGFWDVEDRLKELSAEGDPLERLTKTVNFEVFRPALVEALGRSDPSKGGRPGFDPVLKFKMLVPSEPCTVCRCSRPIIWCGTG